MPRTYFPQTTPSQRHLLWETWEAMSALMRRRRVGSPRWGGGPSQ